jgi:hypothetical protein
MVMSSSRTETERHFVIAKSAPSQIQQLHATPAPCIATYSQIIHITSGDAKAYRKDARFDVIMYYQLYSAEYVTLCSAYNTHWLVARHGHRTPAQVRADQQPTRDLAA